MVEIQEEISTKPEDISKLSVNKRSLTCILDCQNLIRRGKFCSRVEIPADFQPKLPPHMTQIIKISKSHYETWVVSRYFSNKTNQSFPTFSAVNIIDYSRLREFDVQYLLSYEIVSTSFYLKKDGGLRKSLSQNLQEQWRISLEIHVQQLFVSPKKVLL